MLKNNIPYLTQDWAQKRNLSHFFFKKTESTNKEAKQKAFSKESPLIFIAQVQTKGRGQNKNHWQDSDLMISWLWDIKDKKISPEICKTLAFDVYSNACKLWPELNWSLKEPNDLLLNQKKIAGLLVQVIQESSKKALIIGLGFNVFHHPKSIPSTHLTKHTQDFSHQLWENFLDLNHQAFANHFLK